MSMPETLKAKSAAKIVLSSKDPGLRKAIRWTLNKIADVVGGTLGPHGRPVLIERQEWGLPPFVTKDGVTVLRSLGFQNALEHAILEVARDPANRVATDAGDGTTTATVLLNAIDFELETACVEGKMAPQSVVREIHKVYRDEVEPLLKSLALPCSLDVEGEGAANTPGRDRSWQVARLSANGDEPLADAVLDSFDISGDEGNITLAEEYGSSTTYRVDEVKGYPVGSGYEYSCGRYTSLFVDGSGKINLTNPAFILHNGPINDPHSLQEIAELLDVGLKGHYVGTKHIVLVASRISDSTLDWLGSQWRSPHPLKILPLVPQPAWLGPLPNAFPAFLGDLAALTGGKVFDAATNPLSGARLEDLGNLEKVDEDEDGNLLDRPTYEPYGVEGFEMSRYRSSIFGFVDKETLLARQDEVKAEAGFAEAEMDRILLRERAARLSGGIARLVVVGSSNADTKERRDRAEDAICALRGALRDGCYPAGCWTLEVIAGTLLANHEGGKEGASLKAVAAGVLAYAMQAPLMRLLDNAGREDETGVVRDGLMDQRDSANATVWDAAEGEFVLASERGLYDSAPAVTQALRTAVSAGCQFGTTAGAVVFPRDSKQDQTEASEINDFVRARDYDVDENYGS